MNERYYPIQPGDLAEEDNSNFSGFCGLQPIQLKIINNLIRQTWIPSLGRATITWERLAKEMGTPVEIEGFGSFVRDIEKAYSKAGWTIEPNGNDALDAYIIFNKKIKK